MPAAVIRAVALLLTLTTGFSGLVYEGSIGLWALAFPWLFEGVRRLSLALRQGALLPDVALLLAGADPNGAAQPGALDLQQARRRTRGYRAFHHHAVDFEGERLVEAWRRCQHPEDPSACERGLEEARRLVSEGAGVY